ncbi:hypothetical protein ACVJGD_007790 [Bradyrhizobium sp. USDA 10063]
MRSRKYDDGYSSTPSYFWWLTARTSALIPLALTPPQSALVSPAQPRPALAPGSSSVPPHRAPLPAIRARRKADARRVRLVVQSKTAAPDLLPAPHVGVHGRRRERTARWQPGTGESHIAKAIAYQAILQGHKVQYIETDDFFHRYALSPVAQREVRLRNIIDCDLLVLDDLFLSAPFSTTPAHCCRP